MNPFGSLLKFLWLLWVALCLFSQTAAYAQGYRVVRTYPHDPGAFTQGLVYEKGFLYESTGLQGKSSLRRVDPATGRVVQKLDLPAQYFGEGLTLWGNRLIQLTWKSGIGLVYDKRTFRLIRRFRYPTEGWGITHNGRHLIMSDGSDTLYFLDPRTFREEKRLTVRDQNIPVRNLNELEWVKGEIYANVYLTERIVRISPETGAVLGWIDLAGISRLMNPAIIRDVLNGIAYDQERDRLFVTGKFWPALFEIAINRP
jgi:glutamine cyclotransferase